ncbi:MAG: flagellar biosynthesis anti-sigma factor FlgM [Clostridiales bacterium]|jgi:flagellar biosynthesis anti-sigma factor FlgM|nr:flagellar biosynthesis anti-sigma factor FlgM [Clostridiales bacterium]
MDINAINRAQKVYNIYNNQNSRNGARASRSQENKDSISLSEAGEEYSLALKSIRKGPDVNESKIEELKDKVQNNTYYVETDKLADKILGSFNKGI